tara:strand:+ start:4954 stop:5508 length:555 start_codon:yes stop_codon:yes gene_type:complete
MRKLLLSVAIIAAFSTTSFAQEAKNPFEGAYAGGMIGVNSYSFDDLDENISGVTYGGLLGYRAEVSNGVLLGMEGYVQGNQANKDFVVSGITANVSSDASYGLNATLGFGSEKALLFVVAGWGWNGVSVSALDQSASESDNGIHAGIGGEFVLSETINLRVQGDWQDFDGASSIGGSAGIVFKF